VIALVGADAAVGSEGPYWRVPGGSGYTNVPDLTVLSGLAPVEEPTLELRVPRDGGWTTVATGAAVELDLAGRTVAVRA